MFLPHVVLQGSLCLEVHTSTDGADILPTMVLVGEEDEGTHILDVSVVGVAFHHSS